jgi:hypothetical protein
MGEASLRKAGDAASRVSGQLDRDGEFGPFVHAGRIIAIPARPGPRRLLLDCVAQAFEPGLRYPEAVVDDVLRVLCDDHAVLRRYLVDEGFLSRQAGVYWRSGGTVDLGPA